MGLTSSESRVMSDGEEAIRKAETIEWVFHSAFLSLTRYREILQNKEVFNCVYPGVKFENPKITHTVEGSDYIFTTTKNEIVEEHNFNLFKGHLITLFIVGLTMVLEGYLKRILKNHFDLNVKKGVFYEFKRAFEDKTKRDIKDFDKFDRLWYFYQLRHIIVHNLGRIDQKFKQNTGVDQEEESPNIFYPSEVSEYKELIKDFVNFVDSSLD